ncbi:hypothetical protein BV25DRAFT_1255804 [Artomyces pyxidatus]|uniref:Uncharacterized protein n=1 Tax=Artomyces pyxidatus TaxID=48021 RepID=A0ACB8TEN5_9AGAM|nr:hypothetical protein BV25DRAFT_1255804 [Artomyces pyxidatus]
MEPALAKRVATGEADPCTLLPMEDINPSYVPRSVKPLPLKPQDLNRSSSSKEKGKQNAKSSSVSILNFLAPKEQISSAPKSASQPVATQRITIGRASGKRTLAGVMEADMAAKRMKREASLSEPVETPRKAHVMTQSRFFGAVAGPSRIRATEEFEEIETQKEVIFIDDTDDGEMQEPEEAGPVTQEDGYLSPAASLTRLDTPDLSSPPRPPGTRPRRGTDDFGAERLSSPVLERARSESPLGRPHASAPRVLVQDTPMRKRAYGLDGPDLRDLFDEEEDAGAAPQSSFSTQSSTSGPETPADVDGDLLELDEVPLGAARQAVAKGWWTKWARAEAGPAPLRRRETTVTPDGRHKAFRFRPHTAPAKTKTTARGKLKGGARTPSARKSLVFEDTDRGAADGQWDARARLAAYRCPPR